MIYDVCEGLKMIIVLVNHLQWLNGLGECITKSVEDIQRRSWKSDEDWDYDKTLSNVFHCLQLLECLKLDKNLWIDVEIGRTMYGGFSRTLEVEPKMFVLFNNTLEWSQLIRSSFKLVHRCLYYCARLICTMQKLLVCFQSTSCNVDISLC